MLTIGLQFIRFGRKVNYFDVLHNCFHHWQYMQLFFYFSEKTFDFSKVDLKKLKVHELKQILSDWGEQCRGCSEKADYIKLVEEMLPKYAPDAAAKRGKTDL